MQKPFASAADMAHASGKVHRKVKRLSPVKAVNVFEGFNKGNAFPRSGLAFYISPLLQCAMLMWRMLTLFGLDNCGRCF